MPMLNIIRVIATLAVAFAPLVALPTTATAEDTIIANVDGVLTPTDTFTPQSIYVCEEACLADNDVPSDTKGARVRNDGSFTFVNIEASSTPRLAVVYDTFIYLQDGSKKTVPASGYLRSTPDGIVVSRSFDDGDEWEMKEDLGTFSVLVPEPKKPLPPVPGRVTEGTGQIYGGELYVLPFTATGIRKGTTIVFKMVGCGGKVAVKKVVRKKTGNFEFKIETNTGLFASKIPTTLIIKKAGHTPYVSKATRHVPNRPKKC